jgi:hypothetical protein
MKPTPSMTPATRTLFSLLALGLLAPGVARAQANYKIRPIVKSGDTVAGVSTSGALYVGTLNDKGQLVFRWGNGTLFVYSDGTFTPLVVGGREAPGGKWFANPGTSRLPPMNQGGSVAFAALVTIADQTSLGAFLWDAQAQKLTALAQPGMPAVNNRIFVAWPSGLSPAINNQDEIVFGGALADAAGKPRIAAFFLGRDRTVRPVALPDQELPGGGTMLEHGGQLSLTDAGVVAFRAQRPGDPTIAFSAYQWENGVLTPLALVGGDAPGGGKITRVSAVRLNNRDRSALLVMRVSSVPASAGLYRLAEGQLTAVAVPGQGMPGGGKLLTLLEEYASGTNPDQNAIGDVSQANEAGQFLFRARLADGTRALYRLDPDGTVALLLKQGLATELGEITHLVGGRGIGFNSRGQIALPVRIAGGVETLVLLTPTTP